MSDKVEEALKAARSLREDLMKEADKLDSFAQKARVVQAVGSAASVVGKTAVLVGSGGSLLSICVWASRIGNVGSKASTASSLLQSAHSIVIKLNLDPRWEKLKLDFDNPEELRGQTIEISDELKAIEKEIMKCITSGLEASKIPNIFVLVSLFDDAKDLIRVCTDLYNKAPTESAVLLRKCVDLLDKLIAVYEKMI